MRIMSSLRFRALALLLSVFAFSCSDDAPTDGRLAGLSIVVPAGAGVGLMHAAEDLQLSIREITGIERPITTSESGAVVRVVIEDDDALGAEGFRLLFENGSTTVTAATEAGAMYGLYRLMHDLGVRFIHPEETFFPSDAEATLPTIHVGAVDTPRFERRGFHEHTQHPIVASDILLRAGNDDWRALASNYVRWLARNRQNVMSWQMLRTVDLDTWLPYIGGIVAEANAHHINVGMVLGFVDEQQNAFKLYRAEEDGTAEEQITTRLDRLISEAGFNFLTFQIGASEFTKPADADLLDWLEISRTHVAANHPELALNTWIHITCDVLDEEGGFFFHLPLQADVSIGAWVHTTMYYTLDLPAPVYECEDFTHQLEFADEAATQGRQMDFFPETAWWLGFDNNVPLAMPVTGWSRAYDVQEVLKDRPEVTGHITFTSGREWGYWQYDHHVARMGWDGALTWPEYLEELEPVFGSEGEAMRSTISAFTDLQRRHFYEDEPLIYFYLAGELPQDEVGARVGVLARRPKLAFRDVLEYSDAEFAEWETRDLDKLRAMLVEYQSAFDGLPDATEGTDLQRWLFDESRTTMSLFLERLKHAITLYEGVGEARRWNVERRRDSPDESIRDDARAATMAKLTSAQAITESARQEIERISANYRYSAELLTDRKPTSLTIYKFGYLHETQSAFFWSRRDEQLAGVIRAVFDAADQVWVEPAPDVVYSAPRTALRVMTPDNRVAAGAIRGFLPGLLFGAPANPEAPLAIRVAQDFDDDLLPDVMTEQPLTGTFEESTFTSTAAPFTVVVRDEAGGELATLALQDSVFTLNFDGNVARDGALSGGLPSSILVQVLGDVTGTDEESAINLIKQVYEVDPVDPLPEELPVALTFTLTPA